MSSSAKTSLGNSTNVRSLSPSRSDRFAAQPLVRLLRQLARVSPAIVGRLAAKAFFLAPPRRRVTQRERAGLASGRPLRISTRWGRLAAWSWGAQNAPTVLLVHGWAGAGAQLLPFVEPLRAAGLRVVALDLPAHGASPGRRSSLPRWADALLDAASQLGGERGLVAVVAHSFGATATSLALTRGLVASRVVLVAPAAEPAAYFRGWVGGVVGHGAVFAEIERETEAWLGLRFADVDGAKLAASQQLPALIVHDRGDRETPFAGAEAIARAWSGAELVATTGLGHLRLLADAEVVSRAVTFVREGAVACDNHGCTSFAHSGPLCGTCALERELANPETRRVRAVA